MIHRPLPYYLEDRTGDFQSSDFDEAYDRLFLRVARAPTGDDAPKLLVYDTGRRSSARRPLAPREAIEPAVVLEFGAGGALGSVTFTRAGVEMPMAQYLRRTSMFAGYVST